jgi:hypothetical protein
MGDTGAAQAVVPIDNIDYNCGALNIIRTEL